MSEHPQIQEQLALYPTLARHERLSLEQHLSTCPDCAETLATYTSMDQALHRLVDNKLHCLATQPVQPSFMVAQQSSSQAVEISPLAVAQLRPPWLKRWLHTWHQPRAFVLQLAGAGVLILLLVALSMLFAAWNPAQEHQIASTPTFEHPLATATPQLYGDWGMPVAAHQQTATPLATASLGIAHADSPTFMRQQVILFAEPPAVVNESHFVDVDKAKLTPLNPDRWLIAQRTFNAICAT
ncbi:hypothetical protein BH10CHL1_BH10CHL1_45310 [soil metagenome]